MFILGSQYTKKDLYAILNVPHRKQGGNWNTGYHRYGNDFYLFCNIGVAGRTGHDYNNRWEGNNLVWYGKSQTTIHQTTIKHLISGNFSIYIFTRTNSDNPFTFEGRGLMLSYRESVPVEITWALKRQLHNRAETIPEEIPAEDKILWEGKTQKILVNKYERNPQARKDCLEHYGFLCHICQFDFEKEYGEIGKQFIHVHHVKPIFLIKENYIINPIKDLIPICPNCHAIIHKQNPCFTIEEVKSLRMNKPLNFSPE
jgi:5-methylcytosine-specific restriction protein A